MNLTHRLGEKGRGKWTSHACLGARVAVTQPLRAYQASRSLPPARNREIERTRANERETKIPEPMKTVRANMWLWSSTVRIKKMSLWSRTPKHGIFGGSALPVFGTCFLSDTWS